MLQYASCCAVVRTLSLSFPCLRVRMLARSFLLLFACVLLCSSWNIHAASTAAAAAAAANDDDDDVARLETHLSFDLAS